MSLLKINKFFRIFKKLLNPIFFSLAYNKRTEIIFAGLLARSRGLLGDIGPHFDNHWLRKWKFYLLELLLERSPSYLLGIFILRRLARRLEGHMGE
jgi:hypothetical protein